MNNYFRTYFFWAELVLPFAGIIFVKFPLGVLSYVKIKPHEYGSGFSI